MADPFNSPVTFAAGSEITAGQHNDNWDAVEDYLNARLGASTPGQLLVANASGVVVPRTITGDATISDAGVVTVSGTKGGTRGKSIIATEESRTNVAFGTMTTPDLVSVVLPTGGLIRVSYRALVKNSVPNAGHAAVCLGTNPVRGVDYQLGSANVNSLALNVGGNWQSLFTRASHLNDDSLAVGPTSNATATADPTTGAVMAGSGGGILSIYANAGTYDVSVQFKASSGSISVKDRRLYVEAVGF